MVPEVITINDVDRPFHIGRYPVTMAEYGAFLSDTGWRVPENWSGSVSGSGARMPVSWVRLFDAAAYCYWLREQTGIPWGLPSAAMLSVAARSPAAVRRVREAGAGESEPFPWGSSPDVARCNCAETRPRRPGPAPVDRYETGVSGYGVFDLSGNLWELCGSSRAPSGDRLDGPLYLYDSDGGMPEEMHFRGEWWAHREYVERTWVDTSFGWEWEFDLLGGSYGTPAAQCVTNTPTAHTAPSNHGPYAGFRVMR